MSPASAVVVFAAVAMRDIFWVAAVRAAAWNRPMAAGVWGVAIQGCEIGALVLCVREPANLLPALAGAFVGTYLGTLHGRLLAP